MRLDAAIQYSAKQAHPNDGGAQKQHMERLMRTYGWRSTWMKRHFRAKRRAPKPKVRPYKMVTGPIQTKKPWHRKLRDFVTRKAT